MQPFLPGTALKLFGHNGQDPRNQFFIRFAPVFQSLRDREFPCRRNGETPTASPRLRFPLHAWRWHMFANFTKQHTGGNDLAAAGIGALAAAVNT